MGHIHLDPIGGVAGDMFAAAMTDAFPDLEPLVLDTVGRLQLPQTISFFEKQSDSLFQGRRFRVMCSDLGAHRHKPFAEVKKHIAEAGIPESVKGVAIRIFELLADAEAYVHQVSVNDVEFHEVGSWDSMADIVAAGTIIDALADYTWSVGAIPLGGGRVKTQHGMLGVPAPATTRLMGGFDVIDDGIRGERITPTGLAILAFLKRHRGGSQARGQFTRCGIGFGTRKLPGISNVVRALVMESNEPSLRRSQVAQLTFDVDDQTPEDLAIALERIACVQGVLSIVQVPAFGKKGRLVSQVQILSTPECADLIANTCLLETRTLGLRVSLLDRIEVDRESRRADIDGKTLRVKVAHRPGGSITAKLEADDLRAVGGAAARDELRHTAQRNAMRDAPGDADVGE